MTILIAVFILLSVGVAQADTPQRIGGNAVPDCAMWLDKDGGIQTEGRGCSPYLPKPGCYQKMREAMRLAEGELGNKPPYIPPKKIEERQQRYERGKQAIEQWEATYAECVK